MDFPSISTDFWVAWPVGRNFQRVAMAKQNLLREISKEPDQIEKRHVKDTALSVAYKQQQCEKSMLASKCAVELLDTESAIMMFEAALNKCPS